MAFTRDELNKDLLNSLAVAKQRRATLMAGPGAQTPAIDPNRMKAAFDRRNKKRQDAFGELPLLPNPNAPQNGNGMCDKESRNSPGCSR